MSSTRLFPSDREADLLREKNAGNPKIKGHLSSHESTVIFDAGWMMLQEVPFDSEKADIIIAGMAIWGMVCEDGKYYDWRHQNTPETPSAWRLRETRCYPHKTTHEIAEICNISLGGMLSNDEIQHNIIKIGTRALQEKDLGFEGIISIFNANEFYHSDWFTWTDRFEKYNLTILPQERERAFTI